MCGGGAGKHRRVLPAGRGALVHDLIVIILVIEVVVKVKAVVVLGGGDVVVSVLPRGPGILSHMLAVGKVLDEALEREKRKERGEGRR